MKTTDFHYELPKEYIAQTPIYPRDAARLMILDRKSGYIEHREFRNLDEYLTPRDLLILNKTRVYPSKLFGRKVPTGGKVEVLLLHREYDNVWEALVGGKRLLKGRRIQLDDGFEGVIIAELGGSRRLINFSHPVEQIMEEIGHVPLPPYITASLGDHERYQTIFAEDLGSAAAPTAGLHFTDKLMKKLIEIGVRFAYVTLHIGLDTFAPVLSDYPFGHQIHREWCRIGAKTAGEVNLTKEIGGRVIAVGTTSVRTLETAARHVKKGEVVCEFEGLTDLFILPGYSFSVVDGMVTNFHLPRSTLIMLVSAFAGREQVLNAYQVAIDNDYRFYSFGDAMLVI